MPCALHEQVVSNVVKRLSIFSSFGPSTLAPLFQEFIPVLESLVINPLDNFPHRLLDIFISHCLHTVLGRQIKWVNFLQEANNLEEKIVKNYQEKKSFLYFLG